MNGSSLSERVEASTDSDGPTRAFVSPHARLFSWLRFGLLGTRTASAAPPTDRTLLPEPAETTHHLRNEEPPDDTVVVIRGGQMASEYVRRTAPDAFEGTGVCSLSVYLTSTIRSVVPGEPFLARYSKVRLST